MNSTDCMMLSNVLKFNNYNFISKCWWCIKYSSFHQKTPNFINIVLFLFLYLFQCVYVCSLRQIVQTFFCLFCRCTLTRRLLPLYPTFISVQSPFLGRPLSSHRTLVTMENFTQHFFIRNRGIQNINNFQIYHLR
jgi:hypothetical protein